MRSCWPSEQTYNLQLLINEQLHEDAPRTPLSPWIDGLVVFGRCNPETGLIVASAFERFQKKQNIRAWEKVGAVPLSRKCLHSPKVRRSIGDGNDDQQALVHLIVEHNVIACNALTMEGYNGNVMMITLKPIERTTVVTVPHTPHKGSNRIVESGKVSWECLHSNWCCSSDVE